MDDDDDAIERLEARGRRYALAARDALNRNWRVCVDRDLRKAAAARLRADRIAIMQALERDQ